MTDARSRWALAVITLASAAVLAMGAGVGAAATWHVDDGGGAGIDFTRIQAAVDAASEEDTIIVYNGTYYENVNINKQLTLEGVGMPIVSGSAIDVGVDGCTVDGFYLTGGWYGITVESNNNLIKNNIASGTSEGIRLSYSSHNSITENTISNNNGKGINLLYSNNNNITNNIISSNFNEGIRLLGSNNNTIIGNTVSNNDKGISIEYYSSGNNKLRNNILQDNVYNIHVGCWSAPDYHQDIDTSNTVNGKPIYYWVEEKDKTIGGSTDAGYVALISCNNIVVKDLDLTNNGEGILLVNTTNSTLQDNTISNCGTGIESTYFGNNNDIKGNTLSNNHNGIHIFGSNNTLTGNNLLNNSYCSIDVFGYIKDYYNNQIDVTNSINGKPVYYYFDQDDMVIEDLDTCHLTLAFCSNITLKSNTVNDGDGIMLRFSDNSSIIECTISSNKFDGIYLYYSDDTTIADNNIQYNSRDGIFIGASNNNTITGNDVLNNDDGIDIIFSSNNTLSSNTLNSNGGGILLSRSNDNILSDNEVSDCIESTGIDIEDSANNAISRNNVSNSDVGIKLEDSSSNSIYHNNLLGNTDHAYDDDGTNSWDDGYPSGGNYWSDYTGKYPDAGEIDESGIWDTPYDISGGAGAKDDYPLMESWSGNEYWYNNFLFKGVDYSPHMPGESPEELERANFTQDFKWMANANVNTIRTYDYVPVKILDNASKKEIKVIEGIWFNQSGNFTNESFKCEVKDHIKEVINRDKDHPAIVGWCIGNELNVTAVENAGKENTELFLEDLHDYAKSLDPNPDHFVTHANWPPLDHLDLSFFDVVSFNVYSYWPQKVVDSGYQGYLNGLREEYPDKTVLITEFGYSVSYPRDRYDHYGNNSEEDQAELIKERWGDILATTKAGGMVFEWNDEWWKNGEDVGDEDTHDGNDAEEWFGIIAVEGISSEVYDIRKRPAYCAVKEMFGGITKKVYVVDKSGSGGYTSLADALQSVVDPSPCNVYEIIINPSDEPYLEDWSALYNASKPYIHIKGLDRDRVIIKHDGSTDPWDREGLRVLPNSSIENLTIDCDFVKDSAALIMGRWNKTDPSDWIKNGDYHVHSINMCNCPFGGSTVVTEGVPGRGRSDNYPDLGDHHFYVEDVYYNYNESELDSDSQLEKEMWKAWGHSWKVQSDPGYKPSLFLHYKNVTNNIVELRHEHGSHNEQTCLALIVHCEECGQVCDQTNASKYMKINQFVFLDNFSCNFYAPDYQYYIVNPWEVRNDFRDFGEEQRAYNTIDFRNSSWTIVVNSDFHIYPGTVTIADIQADGFGVTANVTADAEYCDLNFTKENIKRGNRFIMGEGGSFEYFILKVLDRRMVIYHEDINSASDLENRENIHYHVGKSHVTEMSVSTRAPEGMQGIYIDNVDYTVYDPNDGLNAIPRRNDGLIGYPRGITEKWLPFYKCGQGGYHNVSSNIWSCQNKTSPECLEMPPFCPGIAPEYLAPVINDVNIEPTETVAGSFIDVTVHATDDGEIESVTANGIPLTENTNEWNGYATVPHDASPCNHTIIIEVKDYAGHITESIKKYTVLKSGETIIITTTCPVDIDVADPDGFSINKTTNKIVGASYMEVDINGDGDPDDQIVIPDRKTGDYQITVIPEPDAEPTDTYTLKASSGDITIVLAEDIPVSEIPSEPYIINYLKGDLNSDGILTPADAAIALAIAASGAHDPAADVSGDGSVTSLDALMILQAAADSIEL
ncbi:MAG: Cell surface glycoprotein [Candidatus Methanogaster sp.]|nr:MAG: Cell surface glycoprotein [ANME-2 cluster archaeon]